MSQIVTIPKGCKYATDEEARLKNIEQTKERHQQKKEQYNKYQREYKRKLREQKKLFEQVFKDPVFLSYQQVMNNPLFYQQFLNFMYLLNNPTLYQHFINYVNQISNCQGNI